MMPHVYRVLTVKEFVADGFRTAGPGVPADEHAFGMSSAKKA
jgi:hypothetical protein